MKKFIQKQIDRSLERSEALKEEKRALRETPNTENEKEVIRELKRKLWQDGHTHLDLDFQGGFHMPEAAPEKFPPGKMEKFGITPEKMRKIQGKSVIASMAGDTGKPYILAHEMGHASEDWMKLKGDPREKSRFRRDLEEHRANLKGYRILRGTKASKETLREARKGLWNQSRGTTEGTLRHYLGKML